MATNAEAIAAALVEAGVQRAFGLPGGEVTVLLEACRRAGIRFYLVGHEASAAFMADVTGQITERPGVCVATLGPGAMNLGLGVANAYLDRSPVLALTASLATPLEPHFPHQRLPLGRVFGGITKASATVDGRGTADLVARAAELATSPPPGPVHLALPSNLAGEPASPGRSQVSLGPASGAQEARDSGTAGSGAAGSGAARGARAPADSRAAGGALEEIRAMLAGARRPLLVVGLGCAVRDVPALRRFVDRTRMPYVATPKAKGLLPEDAPGFLGVVGGMAVDRAVMETVDQADVLLGAGFDPVECDKDWYLGRRLANLSRCSTAEGGYRPVEALGDIGAHLLALAESTERASARRAEGSQPRTEHAPVAAWPPDLLAAARARVRPDPRPVRAGLSPLAALRAVREAAPRDTILTCDVGSHKYYCGQFWESYEPHTFFMSNGLSAMGYGIPAAIAAKLAYPRRPTLALVGDGGLLMTLHTLTFLAEHALPVVVVCFVDGSLSLIRVGQRRRGLEPYGVDFPAPDFAAIARGFGIDGEHVESLPALSRSVERALAAARPAVISVPVDHAEYEAYC